MVVDTSSLHHQIDQVFPVYVEERGKAGLLAACVRQHACLTLHADYNFVRTPAQRMLMVLCACNCRVSEKPRSQAYSLARTP